MLMDVDQIATVKPSRRHRRRRRRRRRRHGSGVDPRRDAAAVQLPRFFRTVHVCRDQVEIFGSTRRQREITSAMLFAAGLLATVPRKRLPGILIKRRSTAADDLRAGT